MIRAIIIDDEARARHLLMRMLERLQLNQVKIVGEAEDVNSGIKLIHKEKPDLVFLDIKMHQGTGFDLLRQLSNINFEVVFTTAFDQYAVEAFRFSAFGYLLKPIKTSELRNVVLKLQNHLDILKKGIDKRLKVLVESYDDRRIKKLVIGNNAGFKVTHLEEIIRLEGDGNYTHFVLANGKKVITSKTIGEYEHLLNEHGFFRIHQSTIVNLHHVIGYIKGVGGQVEMSDGQIFKLSRHRKPGFLKRFG